MTEKKKTIHLVPNSHLDPVWLWDWREGATEAVSTTRIVLDLMDEYPALTYIRGESWLYQELEKNDPSLFRRLSQRVAEGRWEPVGGAYVQSDMNMPATETMARHLLHTQNYFLDRFGITAKSGWSADCFGHSAWLPDILAAAGLETYAYTRPMGIPPHEIFYWEGPAGARLLTYHPPRGFSYHSERHNVVKKLDTMSERARKMENRNYLLFIGLGNHGGHPTRRMLEEIAAWSAAHPEMKVVYSTFGRFFKAVREEAAGRGWDIPTYRGELNPAPRGVYALAARFKTMYRDTESLAQRTERLAAAAAVLAGAERTSLPEVWEAVMFNGFHDIMPGSCIERALDEQFDWLGAGRHAARNAEQQAITALSRFADTGVKQPEPDKPAATPFLVFNPHPWIYRGGLELEANLDYRPLRQYKGRLDELPLTVCAPDGARLPLQKIESEHLYAPDIQIRNRVLTMVEIPAFGWGVVPFAYEEGAAPVDVDTPVIADDNSIGNGTWSVSASPGDTGVIIQRNGAPLFDGEGFTAVTVEDPWGCWGDFDDSPQSASLEEIRHHWRIERVEIGERGPLRAAMNVRMRGGNSRIDFRFSVTSGRNAVDVTSRVFWDERAAHLKLRMSGAFNEAEYEVMGGSIRRPAGEGEAPGGRWVGVAGKNGGFGFAGNAYYGYNLDRNGDFHVSVARATRYASDSPAEPEEHPWRPSLDSGELRGCFLLTDNGPELERMAAELTQPPLAATVAASDGPGPRSGSLLSCECPDIRLLALKPAEEGTGWIIRLQSSASAPVRPDMTWLGSRLELPDLKPGVITSFHLEARSDGSWAAIPCDLIEKRLETDSPAKNR